MGGRRGRREGRLRQAAGRPDAVRRDRPRRERRDPARGVSGTGGKLPGYVTNDGQYVKEFEDAVLSPASTDGTIIAPFKSPFGWHVVQIVNHPTDQAHLQALKTQADGGADFGALARDNSDGPEAGKGGDLGWVAKSQLKDQLIAAIFAAPVGKTSEVSTIAGRRDVPVQGPRRGDADAGGPPARRDIKSDAFSDWYTVKKAAVDVQRDPAITGSAG